MAKDYYFDHLLIPDSVKSSPYDGYRSWGFSFQEKCVRQAMLEHGVVKGQSVIMDQLISAPIHSNSKYEGFISQGPLNDSFMGTFIIIHADDKIQISFPDAHMSYNSYSNDDIIAAIKRNGIREGFLAENAQSEARAVGGCYVATAVYGSYDCPEVWTLRRFRDFSLSRSWYGRAFIKVYYAVSPTLVKWFGQTAWFNKLWRGPLDWMVTRLKSEGYDDGPYND